MDSNKIGSLPSDVVVDGYEVHIDGNANVSIEDNAGGVNTGETVVDGVTIPDGFYYVGGTKETGLVISDNDDDENKYKDQEIVGTELQGNQFVWVPVEEDSTCKTYDGYVMGQIQSDYMEENMSMPNFFQNCQEPYLGGYATEASEYETMRTSVLEHDGFYVGRYEAGTTSERTEEPGIEDVVVIKQGTNVNNYIGWSDSDDMKDETGGAVELARNFDTANNYTGVESTLIYGVQWNEVMKWMENIENLNAEGKTYIQDSTGMGYYNSNNPTTTGFYAVNNIYDLAGNVYEWTMESCSTIYHVIRGGYYDVTGSNYPSSSCNIFLNPSSSTNGIGFRLTLYLKS